MVLHKDAIVSGYFIKCIGSTCVVVTTLYGAGLAIDGFMGNIKPYGGYYSAPFKHSLQSCSVQFGLSADGTSLSYHYPELPSSLVDTSFSGYYTKGLDIFVIEDGVCKSAHKMVPIYQKSVGSAPPSLIGFKCDSLNFKMLLKDTVVFSQEGEASILLSTQVIKVDSSAILASCNLSNEDIISFCRPGDFLQNESVSLNNSVDNQPDSLDPKFFKPLSHYIQTDEGL